MCEDIRVEFSYGFIECLLTDSLFKFVYGRVEMCKFSISGSSVSEDEIVDNRIEVHVSVASEIALFLSAEFIGLVRMYYGIEVTEKFR